MQTAGDFHQLLLIRVVEKVRIALAPVRIDIFGAGNFSFIEMQVHLLYSPI
jgi:hypothetical protein